MISKDNKILIVGLGLIGGSYASMLTSKGYHVGAIDQNIETINYALESNIIKSGSNEVLEEYVKEFDIIIFALYPNVFVEWIDKYQSYIKENIIITDVTGIKGWLVKEINQILRSDLEFIGAHPMAGREVYGVKNSDKNLFKGANYIITPTDTSTKKAIDLARNIGELLEFKNISILSVEEHDEMIGFLSQLTHCIAISLMTCKESKNLVDYTGDSFRDLTRIAKINENMWSELFLLNKDQLLTQIDLYLENFYLLKEAIENDDKDKLKEIMKLSTERRTYFDK